MLLKKMLLVVLIGLVLVTSGCAVEGFSYSMGLDINKIGTKDVALKDKHGATADFEDPPQSTRNTQRSHDTGPNLFD